MRWDIVCSGARGHGRLTIIQIERTGDGTLRPVTIRPASKRKVPPLSPHLEGLQANELVPDPRFEHDGEVWWNLLCPKCGTTNPVPEDVLAGWLTAERRVVDVSVMPKHVD